MPKMNGTNQALPGYFKLLSFSVTWTLIAILFVGVGLTLARNGWAEEPITKKKIIYPEKTELDFEGMQIEGEVRNPSEFYFQRRAEEKFDSLVKRRKNFHREMLRDVVMSR